MRAPIVALAAVGVAVSIACSTGSGKDTGSGAGPQQTTAASPSPATTGPVLAFGDGTYETGTKAGQVPAGTYRTTVPAGSANCYWARLRDMSGQLAAIIANDNAGAGEPVIVAIAPTDGGFTTSGCGTWHR